MLLAAVGKGTKLVPILNCPGTRQAFCGADQKKCVCEWE